jgi:hypothetical protein
VDPVFRDAQVEQHLCEHGYAVIDALDAQGVAELSELHATTAPGRPTGYQVSLEMAPSEEKRMIREGLRAAYERHLAPLMYDTTVLATGFISKGEEGESTVHPHVDWSMVDETRHRSVNVWIALCDTDSSNGALGVVPDSHRLPLTRRGWATPQALAAPPEVLAEHLTLVPLRAGQAIAYEPRVIHGSPSNTSGRLRVASTICVAVAGAQPVHYVAGLEDDGALREYEVDADFFDEYTLDLEIGRSHEVSSLLEGRPWRKVEPTPPITAKHLRALSRGTRLGRLRRLALRG